MGVLLSFLLVIGVSVAAPAFIAFGVVGAFRLGERRRATEKREVVGMVCRVDADCPPGYTCRDGSCVPTPV